MLLENMFKNGLNPMLKMVTSDFVAVVILRSIYNLRKELCHQVVTQVDFQMRNLYCFLTKVFCMRRVVITISNIFQSPAKKTSIRDQILAKNETEQKLTESGYRLDTFSLNPLLVKLDSRMLQECDNFTRSLSLFVNYGFSLPHLGIFHFSIISP